MAAAINLLLSRTIDDGGGGGLPSLSTCRLLKSYVVILYYGEMLQFDCHRGRWSPTMAASVISPALLFRLVILISLPSGAVKDVQVIQGIVQLVYKILDNIWMNWLRVVAIRMAVGVYYFNYGH